MRRALALTLLLTGIVVTAPPGSLGRASAGPATITARPWSPGPMSRALYGISPPSTNPEVQVRTIQAADGVEIYTETFLPAAKDGHRPPRRIPTILYMSPYLEPGYWLDTAEARDHFVSRGYAFTFGHHRGTGASGGCWQAIGSTEIDDTARVIEDLGRDAPWSNGRVGMYGLSYMGDIQIAVAGRGDPRRISYLKAIIPAAAIGGQYEINFFDGVPQGTGITAGNFVFNTALVSSYSPSTPPLQVPARLECRDEELMADMDLSGNVTEWWRDHEYRAAAPRIRVPTLLVHGFADSQKDPAPLFENIPRSTPHKLITGWWEHMFPDRDGSKPRPEPPRRVHPEWARADWLDASTAWYDRYLKGLPTGVEDWPQAQVQGSDGQWRAEPNWPVTGGPVGQLALGPGGTLGATRPQGSTEYTETLTWTNELPSHLAVFETAPMRGRLQLTGQPVADLWVSLSRPDAHVAVRLEVLDAAGEPVPSEFAMGTRSAQHLEPLVRNRFAQGEAVPAPVGEPVRVQVRLEVTDLVVPPGGRLRMTVAGSVRNEFADWTLDTSAVYIGEVAEYLLSPLFYYTKSSGAGTTVTILHDCAHPSALRFLMPRPRPELLNVRERTEKGPLRSIRVPVPRTDAGGLAVAPVCGASPLRLATFGPALP